MSDIENPWYRNDNNYCFLDGRYQYKTNLLPCELDRAKSQEIARKRTAEETKVVQTTEVVPFLQGELLSDDYENPETYEDYLLDLYDDEDMASRRLQNAIAHNSDVFTIEELQDDLKGVRARIQVILAKHQKEEARIKDEARARIALAHAK